MVNKTLTAFIVMLYGCSSCNIVDTQYPQGWPEIKKMSLDTCPSISGIYKFQGERVPAIIEEASTVNIAALLGGLLVLGRVEQARLELNSTVEVVVTLKGSLLSVADAQKNRYSKISDKSLVFKRKLECIDGAYAFSSSYDSGSEGMVYKGEDIYTVYQDTEGALIVNLKFLTSSSSSLGLLGSSRSKGNYWYRFLPISAK